MAVTASKAAQAPSPVPTNKVISGAVVGAVVTIVIYVFNTYLSKDHQIPSEVSAALTTVFSAIAGYYTNPSIDQTTI